MAKTIQEQIAEMEARCSQLEELQKLFEKAVKNEYGIDAKKIHKILDKSSTMSPDFASIITDFFNLKTEDDYADFIKVFCNNPGREFFKENRRKLHSKMSNDAG